VWLGFVCNGGVPVVVLVWERSKTSFHAILLEGQRSTRKEGGFLRNVFSEGRIDDGMSKG